LESRFYLIYKLRYRLLHMYFRLMAAIFDLPVTPTSKGIRTSLTVLLDPKMWGLPLESRCYLIYEPRYTLVHMYFR